MALARALVDRPAVLLLDEPLGALDLKLREQMQIELKQIQRASGITFVLVTHDQDEALTLADRVVVFSDGRVEQAGPAREVYERPATAFVAGFVGTSNVLGSDTVRGDRAGRWSVRPEKIAIGPADAPAPPDRTSVTGVVDELVYTGPTTRCVVALEGGGRLTVLLLNGAGERAVPERGQPVRLSWRPEHEVRLHDPSPGDPAPVRRLRRTTWEHGPRPRRTGRRRRPRCSPPAAVAAGERRRRQRRRPRRPRPRPTRAPSAPARGSCRCWPGPATPRTAPPARTSTGSPPSSSRPAARSR